MSGAKGGGRAGAGRKGSIAELWPPGSAGALAFATRLLTLEITLQVALLDGTAVPGVSLSNAVQATTP